MFTKGQQVTFLHSWDDKGTVRIVDLTVHSCGKKQMILVDDAGVKFAGGNFRPTEEQAGLSLVLPRLSPEDAEKAALALGAKIVAYERAYMENAIKREDRPETDGYTISVRKRIADLHEPRSIRRELAR